MPRARPTPVVRRRCRRCAKTTRQRKRRRPNGRLQHDCIPCQKRRDSLRRSERSVYNGMVQRCTNPNAVNYKWYGARGIKVCKRWRDSFKSFLADVGPRPGLEYTLDRVDVDGDYEPSNVRWATWEEQHAHRREWLEVYGERKRISTWCAKTGLTREEIVRRLKEGWTHAQAVLRPPGARSRWARGTLRETG